MPQRNECIDGMRGIAALGVVCFHLSSNLKPELQQLLPDVVNTAFSHGYLGVPVFFVISGFVIATSVGNALVDKSYAENFILRRGIRLTPVYWASIVFSFVLLALQNEFLNTTTPFPTNWGLVAHLFYLQDLFAVEPQISVVYWTLCVEIQLYVFYILSVWIAQRTGRLFEQSPIVIHSAIIIAVGIYSIALDQSLLSIPVKGLFVTYWHYFLIGILLSHISRGIPQSCAVCIVWFTVEIVSQIFIGIREFTIAGLVFSFILFCYWRYNAIKFFFKGAVLQYLGAISYTLYLVHPEIGWKVISLGKYFFNHTLTPGMAGVLFAFGVAASIVTAHVFHVCIEKPSLILNSKLKLSGFSGRMNDEPEV